MSPKVTIHKQLLSFLYPKDIFQSLPMEGNLILVLLVISSLKLDSLVSIHHIFLSSFLCQSLLFACFLCMTIQYCPGIEFYLIILHLCSGFIYNYSSRIMFANKFQVLIIDLDSILETKIHMLNYKMCNFIRINNKSSNSTCPKQKLFIPPLNLFLFLYLLFSLW